MNCFTTSRTCIPTIQPLEVVFIIYINIIYSKPNVKKVLKSRKYLVVSNIIRTFASEIQSNSAEDNT